MREALNIIGRYVESLFNKHKLIRRGCLITILWLMVYATLNPIGMSDEKYMTLCGLLTVAIGLYQWDKQNSGGGG